MIQMIGPGGALAGRLLRSLGAAVVMGAGVKAGGDLYQAARARFGGRGGAGESPEARVARLQAEQARVEAELAEALAAAEAADGSEEAI